MSDLLLFTQGFQDAGGVPGLYKFKPIGAIVGHCWSEQGKKLAIERIKRDIKESYPNVVAVFNCKFELYLTGHPNNGNYAGCVIGDGYIEQ